MEILKKLNTPLAVFDLESTGLDVDHDQIIQISIQRIEVDGSITKFKSYVMSTIESHPKALEVHGITKEKLVEENAPTFEEIADHILQLMDGAIVCGKNIKKFDLPMLINHVRRLTDQKDFEIAHELIFDVEDLVRKVFSHTLTNMFEILTGKKRPDDAHDAHADTRDTIIVLDEITKQFPHVGKTQDEWMSYVKSEKEMVDYAGKFYKKDGVYYFNFTESKDKAVDTNTSLLLWMSSKAFSSDTLRWADKLYKMVIYGTPIDEKEVKSIDEDQIGSVDDLML